MDIPKEVTEELMAKAYPDGFTLRDEANAIVAFAIRNSPLLEGLHAGKYSPFVEDEKLSRITDEEMKDLMIEFSERVEKLLRQKEEDPERYKTLIAGYGYFYCQGWNRE